MSRMDDLLKEALRREEPPAGFAERVLARVNAPARPTRNWFGWWRAPALRWAGAGVLAALIAAGGFQYEHERARRAEGELAKQRLVLALRIAGSKLHAAQAKVLEIGSAREPMKEEQ